MGQDHGHFLCRTSLTCWLLNSQGDTMKRFGLLAAVFITYSIGPLLLRGAASTAYAVSPSCPSSILLGEIFAPEPIPATTCYASQNCSDGSTISCSCPDLGSCTASYEAVDCDCTPDPDYHYTCPEPPPTCPQEGASCVKNLDCGTCMGAACFCSSRRCVCIA